MANIEVSLSCGSNTRRRRGISLGGNSSTRTAHSIDTISHSMERDGQRLVPREREAIMKSFRTQLDFGKSLRCNKDKLEARDVAECELRRLKSEAENKRGIIQNLKTALESLDVSE